MRWAGRQGSRNVQDRRGMGGLAIGGGVGGIIIVVLALLMGQDPLEYLNQSPKAVQSATAADDEKAQFVSVVLKDTEMCGILFLNSRAPNIRNLCLSFFRGT